MSSLIIIIIALALCCIAGILVVLLQRYSSSSTSLYRYIKSAYPEKYENLLRTEGKILTIVSEGSASVPTEIGLFKSRPGYQFKVLDQIAQINPNDEELQKQVTSMTSTLKVALSLLYGALGLTLLVFVAGYIISSE